jgi:hypothetical protein
MIPLFLTGLLGALLVAAFLIARRLPPPPSEAISTVGGKEMRVASLAATPYYLQTDDRWKKELLGPTREPIAAVGGAAHWVLVVVKDGDEYLVKDPLYKERSPRRLSEISDRIHSVRILRRRGE